MRARLARLEDSATLAQIYNQGIEDRVATFETRLRTAADVEKWFDGVHPIVVVEDGSEVIAFASTSTYRPRECYAGIAECSAYVASGARGRGAGQTALLALFDEARNAGFHKLVSRVFPENHASLRMLDKLGWRRVGIYERHGQLDGVWKDVVIVEKLLFEPRP
jgi:L-amino acid N-acyltransferase YncA